MRYALQNVVFAICLERRRDRYRAAWNGRRDEVVENVPGGAAEEAFDRCEEFFGDGAFTRSCECSSDTRSRKSLAQLVVSKSGE